MKLVIGLGNPGKKYQRTRHNVGFDVVGELGRRYGTEAPGNKYEADFLDVRIRDQKVLLISPLTFMNLSGKSVWQFIKFYQPEMEDVVVVCDDMNLATGRLRWRPSGSAGGQKGLADIIQRLGHQDFPRLRFGIDRPPRKMDVTPWVLGRFREEEKETVEHAVLRAADSIEYWIAEGIESTMTEFNRPVESN